MKSFTVYDLNTGQIKRWGQVPENVFEQQAGIGEGVIEGSFDHKSVRIVGGIPVKAMPAPPRVPDYREQRAAAYPSLVDQIEAIMKGDAALEDMRARVQAVRDRFPKP